MKRILSLLALLAFVPVSLTNCTPPVSSSPLDFSAGIKGGSYYQAAEDLAEVFKQHDKSLDIKETSGSIENIEEVGNTNAQLGFAQLDAIAVLQEFIPNEDLRKIANQVQLFAPVNNEAIHIIVNKSSGIQTLADLQGKKVSIGPSDSGTAVSAILIYESHDALNLEEEEAQGNLVNQTIQESIKQVANGEIAAAFYTSKVGTPLLKNLSPEDVPNLDQLELLSIDTSTIKEAEQIYVSEEIPSNTYPWETDKINTVSTFSFLIANQSLEQEEVCKLAEMVYHEASELKAKNSFWKLLSVDEAERDIDLGLDYHPGVKQFILNKKC